MSSHEYVAVLKLEFRAADHDAANEIASMAIGDLERTYGGRITLVNDQCEQVEISAGDMMDDGPAR